jgi:hypothetical protein
MRRYFASAGLAVVVGAGAFILATSAALPEQVASHFVHGGQANGWMPRATYVGFMVAAAVVVPLVLVTMLAWLPRIFPRAINLPNRDYWFDVERRDATLASLSAFAWGFASAIALLVAGLHRAVVAANDSNPPILSETTVDALLAGFVLVLTAWIVAWFVRFRRPRTPP